jgi:uncharacterized protein
VHIVPLQSARDLLLACQGLQQPLARPATRRNVLAAVRQMHVLQIDTISVVARSPYLVLYSRLGSYEPRWLDELHAAGKLTEHWAHAECFLPMEDYVLFASLQRHGARRGLHRWLAWAGKHKRQIAHVRERIHAEGGLKSSDFINDQKRGTWWDWKVEKVALEYLHVSGEVMIARREGFQRVYDLRERVLPNWDDSLLLDPPEVYRRMVANSAMALGVATEPWLRDYYRLMQKTTKAVIGGLLEIGELIEVELEGNKDTAYVHRQNMSLLRKALRGDLESQRTELLSPFDPIVWHRQRAAELFRFDYQIECYTVAAKRKYGYFTLPILHNGALIGRLDPKAHRREGIFEVKALHLEPGMKLTSADWQQIAGAIQRCAVWHGTPEVRLGKSSPASAGPHLKAALKKLA